MAKYGVVTSNIDKLLKEYPKAKNDDKLFVVLYWKMFDKVYELNEEFIERATSSESLLRLKRRYLSKKGESIE